MSKMDEIKKADVLKQFGNSFIKVPRRMVNRMLNGEIGERKLAKLHFTLICLCYHKQGYVLLDGQMIHCRRGEYVGSIRTLANHTLLARTTIGRLLKILEDQGFISMERVPGGSRIKLYGYDDYMTNNSKPAVPDPPTPKMSAEESLAAYEEALSNGRAPNKFY